MITILNLIRIIYSNIMMKKYNSLLDGDLIEEIESTHTTWWLSDIQICMYCNYMKQVGRNVEHWTKPQMFREVKYHNVLYKWHLFRTHTDHAYLEKKQTLKTYIRRIIGNCLY